MMDENIGDLFPLDSGQSFIDYMKDFTSFPNNVFQDVAETQCELAEYDSVVNSKGKIVLVRNGTGSVSGKPQGEDGQGYVISRTTYWDSNGEKVGTSTDICSSFMKAALKEVVPMYRNRNIKFNHISFIGKPDHLFHFRNALYTHAQSLQDGSLARKHVTLLFNHLQQELSEAVSAYTNHVEFALEAPSIDFPHLWTIFMPGELIYLSMTATTGGAVMLANFKSVTCNCTCNKFLHRFHHSWEVQGDYIDSNGKSLGHRDISTTIPYFDGVCNLDQLPVLPLRFHPDKDNTKNRLAARGQKYVQLQGRNHRYYKGPARIMSGGRILRVGSDERIIWVRGRIMTDEEAFFKESGFLMTTLISLNSHLSENEYLICRSHVRAFSFSEDKWGDFDVDLIEPIEFDTAVFKSSLMLEDKYKNMLLSLVRMQEAGSEVCFKDVIGGKGEGLVFLLHGEPGVGKTMTAESLAECCKRPLLRINGDRLKNASESFEVTLSRILRLAHSWQAIALLDEADIFLEQRSQEYHERNSLATAFLRILEYHHGVLFLTTNRVNSFDRAFKSRIQVAIYYPPLNAQSRQTLWQIFLSKSSRPATKMEDWCEISAEVASEELNGRQIRDVVRSAHASAYGEGCPITMRHLRDALDAMWTFEEEFEKGRDASEEPTPVWHRRKRRRL